jgi:hypothetical protein
MIKLKTLNIPADILLRLCEIDEFKGLWNGLDDHTTGLNLIGEVAAHGAQFKTVLEPLQKYDLSPQIVQTLHMAVCKDTGKGKFKTAANTVKIEHNGKIIGELETAQPEETLPLLTKLLEWTNQNIDDRHSHPLLVIAIFSTIFLQIGPFSSQNQKLLKLLIALLMLKSGYRYAPFASFDEIMNRRAHQIFEAMTDLQNGLNSGKPDWSNWIRCFLDVLIDQKNQLYTALYDQNASNTIGNMPDLSIAILDFIGQNKRVTMREIMKHTRGKRSTIKLRLQELLESDRIIRHGAGRSVWYSLI